MKNFVLFLALFYAAFSVASDTLLSDAIPYPYYEVQKESAGFENKMMILNSGMESFEKRLEMIRNAKVSVEVEYFIYDKSRSGRLLTQELVAAAQRGVKVRILVDKSAAVVDLNEYFAEALSNQGIELRFYNAAPLYRVSSIQFRNHRKILIADDINVMVGGRNIADDYFDMSKRYNFYDRDAYIEGPIAKTIRLTFDEYFDHVISERPEFPIKKLQKLTKILKKSKRLNQRIERLKRKYDQGMSETLPFIKRSAEDEAYLEKAIRLGRSILDQNEMTVCPELTWSTDRPGGNWWRRLKDAYSKDYRYLRKTIYDKAIRTNKHLYISSPYLMNNKATRELMYEMLNKDVKITTYTNSLSSTDAVYVASNLYKDVYTWRKKGIITNVHQGNYIPETEVLDESITKARWGTHSKTYLFENENEDENEFMISTYNVDNRSNHYNTELGLFCKGSAKLYNKVKDNILSRIKAGMEIKLGRKAVDNTTGEYVNRFGKHPEGLVKMRLLLLPAWLFKFLL